MKWKAIDSVPVGREVLVQFRDKKIRVAIFSDNGYYEVTNESESTQWPIFWCIMPRKPSNRVMRLLAAYWSAVKRPMTEEEKLEMKIW